MNNAEQILKRLDQKLTDQIDLTLFGRAALQLGFDHPLPDYALSQDIDAVLWMGQAEELNSRTNFWSAVEMVNNELSDINLYICHFFVEDQIIRLINSARVPDVEEIKQQFLVTSRKILSAVQD